MEERQASGTAGPRPLNGNGAPPQQTTRTRVSGTTAPQDVAYVFEGGIHIFTREP